MLGNSCFRPHLPAACKCPVPPAAGLYSRALILIPGGRLGSRSTAGPARIIQTEFAHSSEHTACLAFLWLLVRVSMADEDRRLSSHQGKCREILAEILPLLKQLAAWSHVPPSSLCPSSVPSLPTARGTEMHRRNSERDDRSRPQGSPSADSLNPLWPKKM